MGSLSTDELTDLREPIRRVCAERFDRSRVRETGRPESLSAGGWQALAEVGVLGALAPTELGGVELGFGTVSALIEECGHGLAPGPLVYSCLAATLVEGVATGELLVSGAICGPGPILVEHGCEVDAIIVLGDQVELHPAAALDPAPTASVDPLISLARITLPAPGGGDQLGDSTLSSRWLAAGSCLAAAYLVGLARRALELAREHAVNRVQFGRPIAGFQAVKHLLADVLVGVELAAAAVATAADELDHDSGAGARACASAKLLAGDAAALAAKNCIQVHGGMGYAWESDPHLLWKRAMIYERQFGSRDAHAHAIAATLGVPS